MTIESLANDVSVALLSALNSLIGYLPNLVAGILIIVIGVVVAGLLRRVVEAALDVVRLDEWFKRYGVTKIEGRETAWSRLIAEIVRWFLIIAFLIPAAQAWGLGAITGPLSSILLYLPNVAISVIVAIVGVAVANLAYHVVLTSAKPLGAEGARVAAMVARWAVLVFTAFAVLSQLGVAAGLIQTLFTGIVAALALSVGLAFGLGGQEAAKGAIKSLSDRLR